MLRRIGDSSLLAMARPALLQARALRPAPARDDKAVLAWNGLLLRSLCEAAGRVGDARYRAAAVALGARLGQALQAGPLGRTLSPDAPAASLEDRAALGLGLLALHALTGDAAALLQAARLGDEILTLHQDPVTGSLLAGRVLAPELPLQPSPVEDGAEPSAVGLALLLLLGLQALGDRALSAERVRQATQAAVARLSDQGWRGPTLARALARQGRPARCLVLTGAQDDPVRAALLQVAARRGPRDLAVLVFDPAQPEAPALLHRFGSLVGKAQPGPAQAWLCEGASCRLPQRDPQALGAALQHQPAAAKPSGSFST